MSECDCANMKWEDQDGNELDAVVCRMCCNDIADLLDQKELTIIDLETRIKELEATLKTLAAQAMHAAGYTKKGDWKNENL